MSGNGSSYDVDPLKGTQLTSFIMFQISQNHHSADLPLSFVKKPIFYSLFASLLKSSNTEIVMISTSVQHYNVSDCLLYSHRTVLL